MISTTPKPSPTLDCARLSLNTSNSNNGGRRSSGDAPPSARGISAVSDPVFSPWKPSERFLSMTAQQIEEIRFRLNVEVTSASGSELIPAPIEHFSEMRLLASILKDLLVHESRRPTAMQAQAMPVALSGRDLLCCAESVWSKVAAFAVPMIQHCVAQSPTRCGDGPLALVLTPTRELAQGIGLKIRDLSKHIERFKFAVVVGGTNMSEQRPGLREGVDVVVATPGRFISHLENQNTSVSRVTFVVLDEADQMLDMGFEPQIREVMRNLPEKHQTLLFCATVPVEIKALAQEYLSNPVQVKVGNVSSPKVSQILEMVSETEKVNRLLAVLAEEATQAETSCHPIPATIVFVKRRTRCDEVADALVTQGLRAVSLHGGRTHRERETASSDFTNGTTKILVSADGASRGLDLTGAHVINLDLPKSMEYYNHRIGRTCRAGLVGQATSFYTDCDLFLAEQMKKTIPNLQFGGYLEFATGKVKVYSRRNMGVRRKEKDATTFSKLSMMGPDTINIEDKYRFMIVTSSTEGVADSAWDD